MHVLCRPLPSDACPQLMSYRVSSAFSVVVLGRGAGHLRWGRLECVPTSAQCLRDSAASRRAARSCFGVVFVVVV